MRSSERSAKSGRRRGKGRGGGGEEKIPGLFADVTSSFGIGDAYFDHRSSVRHFY